MTQVVIDDIIPRTQLLATAGQTVFNTNWTADEGTDVDVYARADGVPPDDVTQLVSPSLYIVTFVGGSQTVRVTFLSGRVLNDIITIVRNTPAERLNLYINTNFVPSMLNQDFGILTLVDQQAQMYDTVVNPGYNVSAIIDYKDKILPILEANQVWAMNESNTKIIAYDVPAGGGIAPSNATYLLQIPNVYLPNAQAMSALESGVVCNTITTGVQITRLIVPVANQTLVSNGNGIGGNITIGIAQNARIPGIEGIGIPFGTTGQRPSIPVETNLRFNTDLIVLEYWDGSNWVQISEDDGVLTAEGTQHQILVNGTFGIPTDGAIILTTPQDIDVTSSPTFDNLQLSGGIIIGADGTTVFELVNNALSVNYIRATSQPTGVSPSISARGSDTNIDLTLSSKGTGVISLVTGALTQPLLLYSGTSNQHLTRFNMANTVADRSVTFQDSSGTVAWLTDIPSVTPSALTKTDDANVTLTLGGSPNVALLAATSLTLGWTGILSGERGGTGVANTGLTINLGSPTTGYLLTSDSSGNATWQAPGYLTGAVLLTPAGIQTITAFGLILNSGPFISGTSAGSGVSGSLQLYNAAASAGNFRILAAEVSSFTQTVSNSAVAQETMISVPDPGASTANFLLDKAGGTVTLNYGLILSSVNFGQTTLSNYTQGTFIPTVTSATPGDLSVSYTIQDGAYTRMGRLIHINYTVQFTPTFTTAMDTIIFGGLPVASAGNNSAFAISFLSSGWTWPAGKIIVPNTNSSTTNVILQANASASATANVVINTTLVSGVQVSITFSGMYYV